MSVSGTMATPRFSNKWYDRLKYIALVLLPALATLYFGLDQIWGLPKATEVVGTITTIDTFLGLLLRQSNQNYRNSDERFDGEIEVVEDEVVSLNLDENPEEALEDKEEVVLKVDTDEAENLEFVEKPKSKPRKRTPKKQS